MIEKIEKTFKAVGLKAYLCGGTVRDLYMGLTPYNWDVSVNSTIVDLKKLFEDILVSVDEYNNKIIIEIDKVNIHVYPLKKITLINTYYNYEYTSELKDDSNSRDFTINAMYYDISNDKYIDFHDSAKDIANKIIKFIGDPQTKILESKVRLLRAPILSAILGTGWNIDYDTAEAIKEHRLRLIPVNSKQIYQEFYNLFTRAKVPSKAFNLMRSLKLLEDFFPELHNCIGIEQSNKSAGLDLNTHIMYCLDSIKIGSPDILVLRLAALLHDIGKPYTKIITDTGMHFYNHEHVGSYLSDRILNRWGFPKHVISKVCTLVANHLFDASPKKSEAAIKKLITKVGVDNILNLIELRIADRHGTGRKNISMEKINEFKTKVEKLLPNITANITKLNITDTEIQNLVGNDTDNISGLTNSVKLYLKTKLISDTLKNKKDSLKNAVIKVNKINCPLGKIHLFDTWNSYNNDTSDVFPNGFLKCGVYCNFTCNKYLKPKPKG